MVGLRWLGGEVGERCEECKGQGNEEKVRTEGVM